MTRDEEYDFLMTQLKSAKEQAEEVEEEIKKLLAKKTEIMKILRDTREAMIDYIGSI